MIQIPKAKGDLTDLSNQVRFKDAEWDQELLKKYPTKQPEEAKSGKDTR
jgi:hypothetical protein